jgi:hypothetical protein
MVVMVAAAVVWWRTKWWRSIGRRWTDSDYAAAKKYHTNIRLTLWDGERIMPAIVDTRATARAADIWTWTNNVSIRRYTCLPYSVGGGRGNRKIVVVVFAQRRLGGRCCHRRGRSLVARSTKDEGFLV